MSCNAIATITAYVRLTLSAKTFKLLNDKQVEAVLNALFQNAPHWFDGNRFFFQTPEFDISVYKSNGAVRIYARSEYTPQSEVDALADKIKATLEKAAGLVLQEKVRAVVAARGQLESAQRVANGALVLTCDL